MRYKHYIPGAPPVSQIGLGGAQLGFVSEWPSIPEKLAQSVLEMALERGVNFIDTAPRYCAGQSEERIGRALQGKDRSKVVINTKFGFKPHEEADFSLNSIRESLEKSLRRLNTDYVDSFFFHNPPKHYLNGKETDLYALLEDLKQEGKIRTYGASLDNAHEMHMLMDTTDSQVIEAQYSILHQETAEAFEKAQAKKVAIIAKIPLGSG
jgi:aryl-alcohol dehydrogenase-like predicted oxidoreductase